MNAENSCASLLTCNICERRELCSHDQEQHGTWLVGQRLGAVRRRILVLSNKGGVGKSTIAANLAAAMAMRGLRVGLADADLSGPSVPHMLGLRNERIRASESGMIPLCPLENLKVVSLGFMLPDPDSPVMWRDSFKYEILQHLMGGVDWGALDLLILDMPPGTGGELIGALELIGQVDGAVVVTTPQEVALSDVRRGIAALQESGVPVLGIVENMAGLACPHCGGEIHPFKMGGAMRLVEAMGVPLLCRIPLDPLAMDLADEGRPVVLAAPASPVALPIGLMADALKARLAL